MAASKTHSPASDMVKDPGLSLPDMLGLEMRAEAREIAEATLMGRPGKIEAYDDTIRWPVWKSAILVTSLCLGFWICAASLLMYVLS
jgi:hypothetical protein